VLDARSPWHYRSWEPLVVPGEIHGGGGTSFVPVFDWLAECRLRPDLLLYFTDAEGDFPQRQPLFSGDLAGQGACARAVGRAYPAQ